MSDVLKGMTRAEARALVAACDGLTDNGGSRDKLLALAALGAEVVGAKEMWMDPDEGTLHTYRCEGDKRVLVLEGE